MEHKKKDVPFFTCVWLYARTGDVDIVAVTRLFRFAYKKSKPCKLLDKLQASADCPKGRNRCAGIHTADA